MIALTVKTFSQFDETASELSQNLIQQLYPPQVRALKTLTALPHLLHTIFVLLGEKPVGCASFYHNPHLRYTNRECLLIGNFESVPDEAVAHALFSHADTLAVNMALPYIIGPMNGSTWEEYRLMRDTAPPLFFTEKPHRVYYNDFFKANAFEAISQYTSDISTQMDYDTEALLLVQQQMKTAGLRLRQLDLDRFEEELVPIYDLCSAGFCNSFLYTPITQQAFIERYQPLRTLIDPAFALVAEDAAGMLQSLYLCLPDVYCRDQKQLIIKTIVKHPQCQHKGIMAWMGAEIYRRADAKNYKAIIHAFMQETARSNPLSQHFGGTPYRRYVLYGKAVM